MSEQVLKTLNFGGETTYVVKPKYIENMDSTNPISLRTLESGVYILYGYFKPFDTSSQIVMAQSPLYTSVVKGSSMSYVQLFYAVNNSIQYFEITDEAFTLETSSLKGSSLNTNDKTIIGAINELYNLIKSGLYKEYTAVYVTTTEEEETITIPSSINYTVNSTDTLEVNISGLRLASDEYTINTDGTITLVNPLSIIGTKVEFINKKCV